MSLKPDKLSILDVLIVSLTVLALVGLFCASDKDKLHHGSGRIDGRAQSTQEVPGSKLGASSIKGGDILRGETVLPQDKSSKKEGTPF